MLQMVSFSKMEDMLLLESPIQILTAKFVRKMLMNIKITLKYIKILASGWLARVDPCQNPSDYASPYGVELTGPGNNCKTKYKWAWKQSNGGKYCHMVK